MQIIISLSYGYIQNKVLFININYAYRYAVMQ